MKDCYTVTWDQGDWWGIYSREKEMINWVFFQKRMSYNRSGDYIRDRTFDQVWCLCGA